MNADYEDEDRLRALLEVEASEVPLSRRVHPEKTARNWLVHHVGRLMVVATSAVVRGDVPQCVPVPKDRCHLVPLTELACSHAGEFDVLWITHWMWEIVRKNHGDRKVHTFDEWIELIKKPVDPFTSGEGRTTKHVVLCPAGADLQVTSAASLRLEYLVGGIAEKVAEKGPLVSVHFECNGASLALDPRDRPYPDSGERDAFCRAVLKRLPQSDAALRELFTRRLSHLGLQPVTKDLERDKWWTVAGEGIVDRPPPEFPAGGPADGPLAALCVRLLGEPPPLVAYMKPATEPDTDTDACDKRVAFVLLCGGIEASGRSDVVHPCRRISVAETAAKKFRPTIIEWHLRRLNILAKQNSAKYLVVVTTTPETHADVEQEVFRLRRDTDELDIRVVQQELRPQVLPGHDGGWELATGGHLHVVRTLRHRFLAAGRIFVLAHYNNLGDLYNDETLDRAMERSKPENSPLAVEMVKVADRSTDETSSVNFLASLTYLVDDEGRRILWKSKYERSLSTENQRVANATRELYSTGTWYADVGRLDAALEDAWKNAWTDVDRLTHAAQDSDPPIAEFKGIGEAEDGRAHRRFIVARTEDEITAIRETFDKWADEWLKSNSTFLPPQEQLPGDKPLVLIPSERHKVWGGDAIRKRMELWPSMKVGEVWYGSDPRGAAMYSVDGRLIPFEGDFPVMVKYLDCQETLSVQVHPDQEAIRALKKSKKDDNLHPRLKDDLAKEETFLVLQPAPGSQREQLIYGFRREALQPLANGLFRVVREWFAADDEDRKARYAALLKQLRSSLDEHMIQKVSEYLFDGAKDKLQTRFKRLVKRRLYPPESRKEEGKASRRWIQKALEHQLCRHEKDKNPGGLELIVAAIGVIEVIRRMGNMLRKNTEPKSWLAEKLSGEKLATVQDNAERLFEFGDHHHDHSHNHNHNHEREVAPRLGRFFMTLRDDTIKPLRWGRVLPGTVHAWRGNGSFLVEISEPSDNTFRILDFGRELDGHGRDMHHFEAMFSLRESSIVASEDSVSFFALPENGSAQSVHAQVYATVKLGATQWTPLPASTGPYNWHMIMNPDNGCELQRAEGGSDSATSVWRVPPCRATWLVGNGWEVRTPHGSDRIVVLQSALRDGDVHAVALGADAVEFGSGSRTLLPGAQSLDLHTIGKVIAERSPPAQLGLPWIVVWPGYYRNKGRKEESEWRSTRFGNLTDGALYEKFNLKKHDSHLTVPEAAVQAISESLHPDGLLRGHGSTGLVLNLGIGACVGFKTSPFTQWWEKPELSALSAIGRFIFVNTQTGEFRACPGSDMKSAVSARDAVLMRAFDKAEDVLECDGRWLRVSKYLSWPALSLRWSLRKRDPRPSLPENLHKFVEQQRDFTRSRLSDTDLREIAECIERREHKFSEEARRFVTDVAYEVACLLTEFARILEVLEAPKLLHCPVEDLMRKVVLTGRAGDQFGRASYSDGSTTVSDLFVHVLQLVYERDRSEIARTRITSPWERAVHAYRALRPESGHGS